MNVKKVFKKVHKLTLSFLKKNETALKNSFILLLVVMAVGGGIFFLWAASLKTPDLNSFDSKLSGVSTKIYDRTGEVLLYDVNQTVRRTIVPYEKISPYIKNATIAIEDEDFYKHNGIKISSIFRAFFANIGAGGFSQGGSTITQQVIKNSLLTRDKTISRKIKEWVLAIKLERTTDKDSILNLYLNQTPYGGNIYGIEEASRAFFDKHAEELTLPEAAYLAALPQAPTFYSPFGTHTRELEKRKDLVLEKMYQNKMINKEEYEKAVLEKVEFKKTMVNSLKAPHFVMFIKDYLATRYGEEALNEAGLRVVTTLDFAMQEKSEGILKEYVVNNETAFKAENGGLVAIDPKNGQILTMVGSRDYFDKNIEGNYNVTTALRQPGSSFKPFVYVTLFDKGYTPETILYDVKTEFSTTCSADSVPLFDGATCYSPVNYEGGFKGPMTIRYALGASRNIPAVKALYLAGIPEVLVNTKKLGIKSLKEPKDYGLSLAIGAAEVSPLDMTSAYGTFASNGLYNPYTGILRVEDKNGNVLEEFSTSSSRVFNEQPVLELNDVLSDPKARNSIFTLSYVPEGREMAIKTGTTNDSRDAWIVGYTPNIVVGAWMGNNDNSPMVQKSSAIIVAPMWKQVVTEMFKNLPIETFKKPNIIDTTNLKPVMRGVWEGELHEILHFVNKSDPLGPIPSNPSSDPEYKLWEAGVLGWATGQGYGLSTSTSGTGGITSPIQMTLSSPSPDEKFRVNEKVIITAVNEGSFSLSKADFYLNGKFLGQVSKYPFTLSFVPKDQGLSEGVVDIRVVGFDTNFTQGEASVRITVK